MFSIFVVGQGPCLNWGSFACGIFLQIYWWPRLIWGSLHVPYSFHISSNLLRGLALFGAVCHVRYFSKFVWGLVLFGAVYMCPILALFLQICWGASSYLGQYCTCSPVKFEWGVHTVLHTQFQYQYIVLPFCANVTGIYCKFLRKSRDDELFCWRL